MNTPEEKEKQKLRMRLYRITHKDKINEFDRARWHNRRKFVRRKESVGDRVCMFCGITLASKTVSMKRRKYCDFCLSNPRVKAYLINLYHRRWRQKKLGRTVPPVVLKVTQYKGVGRPPVKSLLPEGS